MKILDLLPRQIFDSRGVPTIEVEVVLEDGSRGVSSVPSGSVVRKAASEARDRGASLDGATVFNAISNIKNKLKPFLVGKTFNCQTDLDQLMVDFDGTDNKERLGANVMLAVSWAFAKAVSGSKKISLYRHVGGIFGGLMPVPMMNIISSNLHSGVNLDIKEFMIMPVAGETFSDAMRVGAEVFYSFKAMLQNKGCAIMVGDHGGFLMDLEFVADAFDWIISAIEKAGYKPGQDILIAIDVDADKIYNKDIGRYIMKKEHKTLSSDDMIDLYYQIIKNYPVFSIEDPLSEHDEEGFVNMNKALGEYVQIVGDDLFATNPYILQELLPKRLTNAVLIKPNQIGTLSEVLMSIDLAKNAGCDVILSSRSGETEDTSLSHLAVGTRSAQIKSGSIFRTDRVAKYNELLRIEAELGAESVFAGQRVLQQFARFRNNFIRNEARIG